MTSPSNEHHAPYPIKDSHPASRKWSAIGTTLLVTTIIMEIVLVLTYPDASSRVPAATLAPKGPRVNCLLFSPDGKYIIASSPALSARLNSPEYHQSELSVWEVATREKVYSTLTPQWVRSLSLTAKGDLLAVAVGGPKETGNFANDGKPREVRLYSFPAMKEVGKLESTRFVNSATLSPDGKWLATASMSDTFQAAAEVKVWDASTLTLKRSIDDIFHSTSQAQFSPDGERLAIIDYHSAKNIRKEEYVKARIRQFRTDTGEPLGFFQMKEDIPLQEFAYMPGGKKVIANHGALFICDLESGKQDAIADGANFSADRKTAVSQDGKWVAIALNYPQGSPRKPSRIIIWDVDSRKVIDDWPWSNSGKLNGPVAISPDKKTLVVGFDKIYLFDLKPN